eukprot:TRINITY_DN58614_c0_g1_i1.p1 TRINITY_DN58614_c0_g1~~TRINITY_DN58614_c0_g1_i1.p1  ORF type:complete len:233 (+),score=31.99 TRINITY_DN58614_c0_g1_i1:51-701(+)
MSAAKDAESPHAQAPASAAPTTVALQVAAFAMLLIFVVAFYAGTPASLFQYHPWFMVAAFIVLKTRALDAARQVKSCRSLQERRRLVQLHVFLAYADIFCAVVGFGVIFYNKKLAGKQHFTSTHSWFGLAAMLLLALQLGLGLALHFKLVAARSLGRCRRLHRFVGFTVTISGALAIAFGLESNFARAKLPSQPLRLALEGSMIIMSVASIWRWPA